MNASDAWWLVVLLTGLALVLGVVGYWIDWYVERERARQVLRDAEQRVHRRGSVIEFYRTVDSVNKHRRRWVA